MAESFITVLNGVITGKHYGDMDADLYGTPYYGHEKLIVPFEAVIAPLEPIEYYAEDWARKSDCRLIDEGLIPMPNGYVREDDALRPMTGEERVITGLDDPRPGYKIDGGKIVPMSMAEQVEAGQITREEYDKWVSAENTAELQHLLGELQTPEALAQAELDEEYAADRKRRLADLLAVQRQKGWPVAVKWPELSKTDTERSLDLPVV